MKSTRKMLALVLALVLCLALFPASASAAGIVASGSANAADTAEFVLYTDGRLVISGLGAIDPMNQWSFSQFPAGYNSTQDALVQTRSMVTTLIIEEGITAINPDAAGYGCFWDCTKLVDVILPVSLNSIGARAFQECSSLVSIAIPSNVTSIGSAAFLDCSNLSSVYLSDGLQNINSQAFMDCTKLTEILIPANVRFIGAQAFANCGSLKKITFIGNYPVFNIDPFAFQGVKADAYYPVDNESWNNGPNPMVTNNGFGGRLTWHTSAAYTASDGWVQKNGNWYYYMNGIMVRDNWVAYNGFWFYFDENGRMLQNGHTLVHDKYYFFAANGVRQSGRQQDPNDGQWRFYDDYGVYVPGYSEVDDGLNMFRNGWQPSADGTKWYYIKDKAKLKGWIQDGGEWFYLDPTTGAAVIGWLDWNGNTYYLRPQAMADADGHWLGSAVMGRTQWIGDNAGNGAYYTFNADGALVGGKVDVNPLGNLVDTGWQRDLDANGNPNPNGAWYFYRSDGTKVVSGWELINNDWYYFNDNGAMKTGWLNWNGDWFYFIPANGTGNPTTSTTGRMVTGFQRIGTTPGGVTLSTPKTYFFKSNGALNGQGWILFRAKWYYLNSDGSVATGYLKYNNNWYFLADDSIYRPNGTKYNDGEMVTGVVEIPATLKDGTPTIYSGLQSFRSDGSWITEGSTIYSTVAGEWSGDCYYDTDGQAVSGFTYIDNKWYYLNPANGNKRAKGFFSVGGDWYYADGNGVIQTGWQEVDGTYYYFNVNGVRVTGPVELDGQYYYFDDNTGGLLRNTTVEYDGQYWQVDGNGVCTGVVG